MQFTVGDYTVERGTPASRSNHRFRGHWRWCFHSPLFSSLLASQEAPLIAGHDYIVVSNILIFHPRDILTPTFKFRSWILHCTRTPIETVNLALTNAIGGDRRFPDDRRAEYRR